MIKKILQKTALPRSVGCFIHISSLPSEQGIGCFDEHAKSFIDFLKTCGMSYWQICPLTPTSIGNSPYQGVSAFAGNPYFINLKELVELKLLEKSELSALKKLPSDHVDFEKIYEPFWEILHQAYDRFIKTSTGSENFHEFVKQEAYWLDNYSLFMALKEVFQGIEWTKWPRKFHSPKSAKKNIRIFPNFEQVIQFYKFVQWIFFEQWRKLKDYADQANIKIIGDVPIFVGLDSADVWANQQLFKLNKSGMPTVVAGVPPDAFSATGQLWGNPVFNWKNLQRLGYKWWINRLQHSFKLYDVVRLDHFRGFHANWEVKATEPTAERGKWVKTAGKRFFSVVHKKIPDSCFIAEDLGVIDDETQELLSFTNFPGMSVLQFAFDGQANNKYLPHCLHRNSILYLGTHDNDTTRGWFENLHQNDKERVQNYLRTDCSDVAWDMIKLAYGSVSNCLILSMADILNLGSEARFNTPNTMNTQNWAWRMANTKFDQLKKHKTDSYLKFLATVYGRCKKE